MNSLSNTFILTCAATLICTGDPIQTCLPDSYVATGTDIILNNICVGDLFGTITGTSLSMPYLNETKFGFCYDN